MSLHKLSPRVVWDDSGTTATLEPQIAQSSRKPFPVFAERSCDAMQGGQRPTLPLYRAVATL